MDAIRGQGHNTWAFKLMAAHYSTAAHHSDALADVWRATWMLWILCSRDNKNRTSIVSVWNPLSAHRSLIRYLLHSFIHWPRVCLYSMPVIAKVYALHLDQSSAPHSTTKPLHILRLFCDTVSFFCSYHRKSSCGSFLLGIQINSEQQE